MKGMSPMAKPLSQIHDLALKIIKKIRSKKKKKLLSPHFSPLILVSDHSSPDFCLLKSLPYLYLCYQISIKLQLEHQLSASSLSTNGGDGWIEGWVNGWMVGCILGCWDGGMDG